MRGFRATRWLVALASIACMAVIGSVDGARVPVVPVRPSPGPRTPAQMGELVATSRVCQSFVAQYDRLARVEVRLTDQGREARGPFHFYLRTASDADRALVSLTHDASEVSRGVYHVFEFPPIEGSAGQSYAFCLEAPEAELASSITAIGTSEDWYPEGEATFRDMWVEEGGIPDLDFRLGYRLSLWRELAVLAERLVVNKPLLCGARWFYALLGAAYITLLCVLLVRFIPVRGEDAS
jgi:hypothetical protein